MTAAPQTPRRIFVLGGARSGKSAFAERISRRNAPAGARIYLATAVAFNDEMAERIAAHRAQRADDGWRTVEAAQDLPAALADAALSSAGTVLADGIGLWLTNRMLADADIAAETDALLRAVAACPAPLVVVSEEVGQGIVPEGDLARRFRDALGRVNQRLAAAAEAAYLVVAGLPLTLKGPQPQEILA